jgi:RNA polymerase sigma-70 factor (sigma-E family)
MNAAEEADFHAYVAGRMDRWRRSAFLLSQDWHTADDVVSIAVGRLYRSWRKAGRADNRDAYAQRVLTRSWLDELRRPWRRERSVPDLPEADWLPPDRLAQRQELGDLLRRLGPRQRAVLVLRFYLDCSVRETAQALRISEGTVRSQSARGLEAIRAMATTRTEDGR